MRSAQPNYQAQPRLLCATTAEFIVVIAGSVTAMLASRASGDMALAMPFTVLASTAFLFLCLRSGAFCSAGGISILAGLTFCWVGDVVGPGNFMHGLYAFLVAHVAFSAAFLCTGVAARDVFRAVLPVLLVAASFTYAIWSNLPATDVAPVLLYTAIISIMVILAGGAARKVPLAAIAAAIFFVSDIFVAGWRYGGGHIFSYLCYPLYYASCTLFALSVVSLRTIPQTASSKADSQQL